MLAAIRLALSGGEAQDCSFRDARVVLDSLVVSAPVYVVIRELDIRTVAELVYYIGVSMADFAAEAGWTVERAQSEREGLFQLLRCAIPSRFRRSPLQVWSVMGLVGASKRRKFRLRVSNRSRTA